MAKKQTLKEVQKILTDHYQKRTYKEEEIDWQMRVVQKKQLKKYALQYGGELIPGKMISLDYSSFQDMEKYCPEAILLINDLGYKVQLRIKSSI